MSDEQVNSNQVILEAVKYTSPDRAYVALTNPDTYGIKNEDIADVDSNKLKEEIRQQIPQYANRISVMVNSHQNGAIYVNETALSALKADENREDIGRVQFAVKSVDAIAALVKFLLEEGEGTVVKSDGEINQKGLYWVIKISPSDNHGKRVDQVTLYYATKGSKDPQGKRLLTALSKFYPEYREKILPIKIPFAATPLGSDEDNASLMEGLNFRQGTSIPDSPNFMTARAIAASLASSPDGKINPDVVTEFLHKNGKYDATNPAFAIPDTQELFSSVRKASKVNL